MRRGSASSEKVRDESTRDVTHLYIETMLGISLYRAILISASKNTLSFLLVPILSVQQY
jgi:hypothetical protein